MPEVELSAGAIEYEDTGGPGPAVVFVHGLMMDGSLWRHVVADLRRDYRCVLPTLPLGAHRRPMRADADLSMRGMVEILGEFIAALELRELTLAMNDWGGPLLLLGGPWDDAIARLVVCPCEAFDNVPPQGAARLLPYLARIPGALDLALLPFRFDRLRRLPMTYGPLSKRACAARGDGSLVRACPRARGPSRRAQVRAARCAGKARTARRDGRAGRL